MSSKDKRKKMLKRLSKLRRLERKEKKKKRTKNRSSGRNSLYQEYAHQKKSRTSTYLLVLFIVLLLAAVGVIVYFFAIKPKLDNKSKCTKNEKNDCQNNEYLDDKKCECLPCEVPNPECGPNQYYDPNNLPYCRNSTKYTKDGKKMYSCQPCPTCPDGKELQPKCGGGQYDSASKNCIKRSSGGTSGGRLSDGAIAGIVFGVIVGIIIVVLVAKKLMNKNKKNSEHLLLESNSSPTTNPNTSQSTSNKGPGKNLTGNNKLIKEGVIF